jgi:hypothetical protein
LLAFFGQRVPLRFKLGQLSRKLLTLLVDTSLNLFMLGLPLPMFFGQCIPLGLEAVPFGN